MTKSEIERILNHANTDYSDQCNMDCETCKYNSDDMSCFCTYLMYWLMEHNEVIEKIKGNKEDNNENKETKETKENKDNKEDNNTVNIKTIINQEIDKPKHYRSKSGRDLIDWCEDFDLMDNAYVFNIFRYLTRGGKKKNNSVLQDAYKARVMLDRYIESLEG